MHQSPDDIFAAHFWAWPDPALKRDAHGRVLFVNAAFLQLFGGQVEDWRGQIVQGWNPPQPGPVPSRFEIRTPAMPGQDEQIYDWMEVCAADGTAFALARNVTVFAANTPPPRTPVDATPPYEETNLEVEVPGEIQPDPSASVAPADIIAQVSADPVSASPAPNDTVLNAAPPIAEPPTLDVPQIDVPPLETPDISVPSLDAGRSETVAVAPEVPAMDAAIPAAQDNSLGVSEIAQVSAVDTDTNTGVSEPAPQATHEADLETERDFERRALPIENGDAVLGNNWRDAVIAKAVGVVDTPDDVEQDAPAASATAAKTGGAIRILLAEDNAINALLTRTLLEAEGHTVETVEDGQLAVEAMKSSHFDMIFMDMRMPNMDGLEATRKIRALPSAAKNLPIIALTANAFDDDRNACFDSGMNDFMTKPVSAEELSEMVSRWTGQSEQALAS
jgi:CheY-like chemotaxis protein